MIITEGTMHCYGAIPGLSQSGSVTVSDEPLFSLLYLESNPDTLRMGAEYLEKTGCFTITTTKSRTRAVHLLSNNTYDAIISGHQHSDLNGIEVLKHLRAGNTKTPFIIFTDDGDTKTVIKALNSGADYYLLMGERPEDTLPELFLAIHQCIIQRRQETEHHKNDTITRTIHQNIIRQQSEEDTTDLRDKKYPLLFNITRHEIMNQIMVLEGFLELAEAMTTEPEQSGYHKMIRSAGTAIRHQIDFANSYCAIGSCDPRWLQIHDLIDHIPTEHIAIHSSCEDISWYADPMVKLVFTTMLQNTIMHGERATEIRISQKIDGETLEIIVEDDGIGIPYDQKEHIFEEGIGKNTGFGLFLSREILAITNSTITETGEPGQGARFVISIPQAAWRYN
ncbi:MAG: hybrid sensor histidine kinase/response regulator [Methanocalculus sp.]|uniref:ATP-binding response regulator n=1 Tax=Methanocalculus sp. TaxID=2004547 RepID=UPI00272659C1|nr:hybrid sensor histidine kinase/response regulator [Methanocalculus sp.]MDO9539972.1 hybrid sensor histidine kinase/response regulator [Methanocalculus sp.]